MGIQVSLFPTPDDPPKTLAEHLSLAQAYLAAFDRGELRADPLALAAQHHREALRLAPPVEEAVATAAKVGALGLALLARKVS